MKDFSLIWIIVLGLIAARVLSGCGPMMAGGEGSTPYYIESYNMDGTKLIVNGVADQQAPSTFNQDQYTIKTGQRLLVRFEGLSGQIDSIKNSWDDELHVKIVPTDATDAEALKGSVKLCPLTKNWMMFATWYKAHPFNKDGNWIHPGADYDASSCITGEVQLPDGTNPDASPSPSPSPTPSGSLPLGRSAATASPAPTPTHGHWYDRNSHTTFAGGKDEPGLIDRPAVIFDIKQWFLSNPEGRSTNYGFILISDNPVCVFGDHSSSYSPRIYWKKPKTYYTGCTVYDSQGNCVNPNP